MSNDMAALCNVGHHSPDCPHQPPFLVRIRSANCRENDHGDCLGMVEQDHPGLGVTDCLCQCHVPLTLDPDPLYVPEPGTDDEPWTVLERVPGFNERIAEGRRQLRAGERVEFAPADRRSRALAVLIVALVVVAIAWRR